LALDRVASFGDEAAVSRLIDRLLDLKWGSASWDRPNVETIQSAADTLAAQQQRIAALEKKVCEGGCELCDHLLSRAERAEAELATERARLDWLEDNSVCYHVCIDRQPDGYSIHNSPPSPGSVRAAIDAAMKEGA
jgi:hypothetical protein